MSLLKYFSKLISKYHDHDVTLTSEPTQTDNQIKLNNNNSKLKSKFKKSTRSKGTSNLIATTTIINKKKVSKVIESYSCLTNLKNPIITIHKNSYRTNNHFGSKLVPIAESSALSSVNASDSLCHTCTINKKIEKPKKYCKCCGKELIKRVNFKDEYKSREEDKELLSNARKAYIRLHRHIYNTNENSLIKRHKRAQFGKIKQGKCCNRSLLITNSTCCTDFSCCTNTSNEQDNKLIKTHMKKSRAITNMNQNVKKNIKQIEYKSFLSNKRKYSKTVCSTLRDNLKGIDKNENLKHRMIKSPATIKEIEETGLETKICSTFMVDFASTPIKLAPKTSTPVKLRLKLN